MSNEIGMAFVGALGSIVAYFLKYEPEDYVISRRNSEECWYPPTCNIMTTLVPTLATRDIEYNKANAIADADGVVTSLFARFKQDVLPTIYQPMCQANGYNATTTQLLANDAYSKTVQDGAKTILDNIKTYSTIRQGDLQIMGMLIGAIKDSIDNIGLSGFQEGTDPSAAMKAAFEVGVKLLN